MNVAFAFSPRMAEYDLGPEHPLRPERFTRAVSLMEAYGLIGNGGQLQRIEPAPATRDDLLRVHGEGYVGDVMILSLEDEPWAPRYGIGPGDTPGFRGMHDASALVAGATIAAVEAVTSGEYTRAFSPAGGLHHAHRNRAAGFCIYNDPAVAIARAIARDTALKVLYLDVDAHHGDGVQEAFYDDSRVLTLSIHEDGRYLFPGTGSWKDRGAGAGAGYCVNVPLPPYATPACYALAFDEVVVPVARWFSPDLIVSQCGADAHWSDPLTSLGMTLDGFDTLYRRITRLSEDVCGGRLVACGGGGYAWQNVVPRAWTLLAAALAGVRLDDALPEGWTSSLLAEEVPISLRHDSPPDVPAVVAEELLRDTRWVVAKLHELGVPVP